MKSGSNNTALLWLAGVMLAVSIAFPNGPTFARKSVTPEAVPAHAKDETIVRLLADADAADKRRIVSVYTGLRDVLKKDTTAVVPLLTTTEQWEQVHARALNLAIEHGKKYPGLDEAIEALFLAKVGTDDVMPGTPEVKAKLVDACATIISSAQ